jgi:N6-adenosine-specific RNA methylase IME4
MRAKAQTNHSHGYRLTETLREHPEASCVPAMRDDEFAGLRADIDERGIKTALEITPRGVVLDGHQRLRIAIELGIDEVPARVLDPTEDAIEYMLLAALQRRQLTPSQRAVLALDLHAYKEQRDANATRKRANLRNSSVDVAGLPRRGRRSREVAAELAGISPRLFQNAVHVGKRAPELIDKARSGELSLQGALSELQRLDNHAEIGPAPPLPSGLFDVLYGDPPWQLGSPASRWSPEHHYETTPTPEIEALSVPAAADAVLFLWAVSSRLPDALQVMQAWGFAYKTSLVWVKPSIGLGFWVRHRHELLLIGQRGNYPAPQASQRPDSVIEARRRRHSQKPNEVYDLIERMYPHASKLELYARGKPRRGWTAWGNQVNNEAAA